MQDQMWLSRYSRDRWHLETRRLDYTWLPSNIRNKWREEPQLTEQESLWWTALWNQWAEPNQSIRHAPEVTGTIESGGWTKLDHKGPLKHLLTKTCTSEEAGFAGASQRDPE